MIAFNEGMLLKTKWELTGYRHERDLEGIKIPPESIMTYIKKKKKRHHTDPFYFLYDCQIVRISYYSFPIWFRQNPKEAGNYYKIFEEIKCNDDGTSLTE